MAGGFGGLLFFVMILAGLGLAMGHGVGVATKGTEYAGAGHVPYPREHGPESAKRRVAGADGCHGRGINPDRREMVELLRRLMEPHAAGLPVDYPTCRATDPPRREEWKR